MLAAVPDAPPNWADVAKPFMKSLLVNLGETLTLGAVEAKLAGLTPPKTVDDFIADSAMNVLTHVSGNVWVVGLFSDKVRADVVARIGELEELFGGREATVLALARQDLRAYIENLSK